MEIPHSFIYLSYGLLYLSVIALWLPSISKIPLWFPIFIASLIFGLVSNQLEFIALIPIAIFYFAVHWGYLKKSPNIRMTANIVVLIMGIGLSAHLFPGFNPYNAVNEIYLSKNALPYNLFLNYDKPIVGIFLLGMSHHVLITHKGDWRLLFKQMYPSSLIIILSIVILAFILGFVRFSIKLPSSIFIWALTNLLFVAAAEEALFRGFIQKRLILLFKQNTHGIWLAIIIASLFFGVLHFAGGIKYIILATAAGFGYGWIYVKTNRIEASILTHFGLNLIHFILFTYPAIAKA